MDLTKEERKIRSHKRAFPEMELSEWGITVREICFHRGKQSDNSGKKLRQQASKAKGLPPRICYNCRQPGHFANKCPNPKRNKPRPSRQGSKANKNHHDKKPIIHVKQGQRNFMGIVSTREHISL
jgi:hypothetical protein